jgi:NitT/TauT family transport system substrate-binding protein
LNSHPEAARRLARASVRALGWIATHSPEQIREKLPESSKSSDVGADLEIIRVSVSSFTTDGKMIPGAPEAIKHYLDAVSDKVRDAKIDLSSTWTDEYLPGAS